MADLGRWTGSSVAVFPTTSYSVPASLFPSEDRNDGSVYTYASDLLTLPSSNLADGYLIRVAVHLDITHNNRNAFTGRIQQVSGTGNFVEQPTTGYARNNGNSDHALECWAFIDNPSASATFEFQWKREVGDGGPAGSVTKSVIEVIPFYYSSIGIYESTTAALYGGTTPNEVTLNSTVVETGNISRSGNVVTASGDNKDYMVFGGLYGEGWGNSRTQRWVGLTVDGSQSRQAMDYFYSRDNGTDFAGDKFFHLHRTSTADVTFANYCYRGDGVAGDQGGASVDGSTPGTMKTTMVVMEFNDSAEVAKYHDSTGLQNKPTTATPVDVNAIETTDHEDTAAFSRLSNVATEAQKDMDVFTFFQINGAYSSVSGSRSNTEVRATVNGAELTSIFNIDYGRGDQGSADTYGWGSSACGVIAATNGDDLGCSMLDAGDNGPVRTQPGWVSQGFVNLDSLQAAPSINMYVGANAATTAYIGSNELITRNIG